jgi:hypothetical protein
MSERCKHVEKNGFNCGSYAFNLYKDGIDQGNLCDVHYWQAKAQRTWVGLTEEEKSELWEISRAVWPRYITYASLAEAKLKEKNT